MNSIGWDFPSTNGGKTDGLNDSGIWHFQENPIKSLTREVIQDSLDAKNDLTRPVKVEFELKKINRNEIPGIKDLEDIFNEAKKFHINKSEETYDFFNQGSLILKQENISVLAIRDRNTTGLTKILETDKEDSHFNRLTKTSGDTAKTGLSNGSFGIGKHAPFAASKLRTMLYGTLNIEDVEPRRGFQGVIKIASFKNGGKHQTQGTGFFGKKEDFLPLTDLSELSQFFRRSDGDHGTDKFIVGFDEPQKWKWTVIEEAVANYMWAILNSSLEVVVDGESVNNQNIGIVVEEIMKVNKKSRCMEYYKSIVLPDASVEGLFETEDGEKEKIKLFLVKGEGYNRRISLIRGTGMKITEKTHIRSPIDFAGTLIVEGEKLNAVLRKMEPPTHEAWKPSLYKKNPKYATKLLDDIYKWLKKEVIALSPKIENDSFELPGLEDILPSIDQEESKSREIDLSADIEEIKSIVFTDNKERRKKQKSVRARKIKSKNTDPKPIRNNKSDKNDKKVKEEKANISTIRAFCVDQDKGIYKIVIASKSSGKASFNINIVGESLVDSATILEASDMNTGLNISSFENKIGPIHFEKNEIKALSIKLNSLTRYSLEVLEV